MCVWQSSVISKITQLSSHRFFIFLYFHRFVIPGSEIHLAGHSLGSHLMVHVSLSNDYTKTTFRERLGEYFKRNRVMESLLGD